MHRYARACKCPGNVSLEFVISRNLTGVQIVDARVQQQWYKNTNSQAMESRLRGYTPKRQNYIIKTIGTTSKSSAVQSISLESQFPSK